MDLQRALKHTAQQMLAELRELTSQYQHNGLRGAEREKAVVAEFLGRYLPARIEFTQGEVVDSRGAHSKECDVIALDRDHVPRLWAREKGKRLVPVEGVYAVLEVKSRLDSGNSGIACANAKL